MKINFKEISIKKAHESLKNRLFSARELAENCLEAIKEKNEKLNVFLEIFDDVEKQAEDVDKMIRNLSRVDLEKKMHPLAGIPIALKDNILVKGKVASGASKILENYRSSYDSSVVAKLKEQGAVLVGRTNMDEFAMGGSTENSAFGVTKNPYDESRVPGGSSGGSAAAVGAGLVMAALGSDTGGSVRQPASFCGVVGLKPTYGAVSRYGLMAMASSLDQIGPLTNSVEDSEVLFSAIRGHDPLDSTTVPDGFFAKYPLGAAPRGGMRIGVPFDFLKSGVDEDILKNFNDTLAKLKGKGYEVIPVDLPYIKYSLPCYYIIMPAEASTNLARYDGMRYGLHREDEKLLGEYLKTRGAGFGKEVRRRIMLGTFVLSAGYYDAYYKKAKDVQALITRDFDKIFEEGNAGAVDAIMVPTAPTPPFKIGERTDDPVSMYLSDIFTVTANIAGIPAISVPSGWVEREEKKLPVGMQVMAARYREDIIFKAAKDIYDS